MACWSTKAAISLKRVKIEEKLLWMAYRKSSTLFRFFGSLPYFCFRFRLYGHGDGRFCLIFARTALKSVLDGTNGLSSRKPCACCRILRSGASRGNFCDSTAFFFIQKSTFNNNVLALLTLTPTSSAKPGIFSYSSTLIIILSPASGPAILQTSQLLYNDAL